MEIRGRREIVDILLNAPLILYERIGVKSSRLSKTSAEWRFDKIGLCSNGVGGNSERIRPAAASISFIDGLYNILSDDNMPVYLDLA